MKLLATFDQHVLGYIHENDSETTYHRNAVRCVVVNDRREVALVYFARDGFYKIPGGGVDQGESLDEALAREVREETGYTIKHIRELGRIEEDRYYCGMHQTSYCYLAEADQAGELEPTAEEVAAAVELRWVDSITTAIQLMNAATTIDEEGSGIGFAMMKARESLILETAEQELA